MHAWWTRLTKQGREEIQGKRKGIKLLNIRNRMNSLLQPWGKAM